MSGAIFIDQTFPGPSEVWLHLRGDLAGKASDELLRQVGVVLDSDASALLVDVGGITHLDNDGLSTLVKLSGYARAAGVTYRVVNAPPLLCHLLSLADEEL